MDGKEFQGRKLYLHFDRKPDAAAPGHDDTMTTHHGGRGGGGGSSGGGPPPRHHQEQETSQIYVGNLSFDTKWYELKDYFKENVGDGVVHLADTVGPGDGRAGSDVLLIATLFSSSPVISMPLALRPWAIHTPGRLELTLPPRLLRFH